MLPVRVDAAAESVAVIERPPIARRDADRQAAVRAERHHLGAVLARDSGGPVRRAVVDDHHVGVGQLGLQLVEDRRQILLLVPGRDENDGVAHRSSSVRAARRCRRIAAVAPSSQSNARRVLPAVTARNSVAMPCAPYTREKKKRALNRCSGAQTTTACSMPRATSSGSVRAAFSAVTLAVGSSTSSTSGPRQAARIWSASELPPRGAQPLKTTASTSVAAAMRSASRTSSRQRLLIRPRRA